MTTSEFTKLLKNPSGLNNMTYEALDKLLQQYPYCNGLRMLLLKKCKNEKHVAFERNLALASMYAADRGKLYDFLQTSVVSNTKVVDLNPQNKNQEEKKTKLTTQLIAPPPIYKHKVSKNPPMLVFQKPLMAKDLAIGDHLADENLAEEADRGLSGMPIEEWLQDFEPPRMDEKAAASKKNFKLSRIPLFDKGMFDFLEAVELPDSTKKSKNKATIVDKKEPLPEKKSKKTKKPPKEEEEQTFPELEELETVDELESKSLESIYEEEETADLFDVFLSKTNNFLKSIGDKNNLKENPVDGWEDNSTNENEDVVSETLADLLALQGKKDKAIKMYKTLSLKFPKKSRSFAKKIEELSS